jgi:hypothetical protein
MELLTDTTRRPLVGSATHPSQREQQRARTPMAPGQRAGGDRRSTELGMEAINKWAQSTLGHSPSRPQQVHVPFVRDDSWRLEDAVEDWMSDVSAGPSNSGHQRRAVPMSGAPSVDAPTSVSDAQTMLHELYASMQQRQGEPQPGGGRASRASASSFHSPRGPPSPPALAHVEQLAPHVRERLASAFERSVRRVAPSAPESSSRSAATAATAQRHRPGFGNAQQQHQHRHHHHHHRHRHHHHPAQHPFSSSSRR